MFVSIDPGLTTGWAIWNADGMVACGIGDPRSCPRHVVVAELPVDVVDDVWIEMPVIYPRAKSPPNDILKLAANAGRWAGRYDALAVDVHFVSPAQWKGQVPKAIHHPRIAAALSEREREIVRKSGVGVAPSDRHNIMDAVGLGLWAKKAVR